MSRKAIRKRSPFRRKSHRKATGRADKVAGAARAPVETKPKDVIPDLVDANARALKIPLNATWRGGVVFNLRLILRLAALVDQFPLPDDTEPGPVFHA
jgi:Protein of unknown function (DUF4089)